jgi:hypothetical protein
LSTADQFQNKLGLFYLVVLDSEDESSEEGTSEEEDSSEVEESSREESESQSSGSDVQVLGEEKTARVWNKCSNVFTNW